VPSAHRNVCSRAALPVRPGRGASGLWARAHPSAAFSRPELDRLCAFATPSYFRLARDLNASIREIALAAKWLEGAGYVDVTRDAHGKPIAFELLVKDDGPFVAISNELFTLDIPHGPKLLLFRCSFTTAARRPRSASWRCRSGCRPTPSLGGQLALRKAGLLLVILSRGRRPNDYRPTCYVPRWTSTREQPSQNGYPIRDSVSERL
jgi:hypothetical protein